MSWRKWFVRGLVFTVVGVCACAVLVYQRWTNPAAVREQVIAKLGVHFPGASATLDSARLHLLGRIVVNELRLGRRDDPDKSEVLHVPSAFLYHDKEKLLDGELSLRKVELHRPRLTVQRLRDGKWNLQGITGVLQPHLTLPTLVIHQGTVLFQDKSEHGSGNIVELTDLNVTLINDPVAVVTIDGTANSEAAGKVQVHGQWQRGTQEVTLSIKAVQMPLSGPVADKLEAFCPGGTLQGLRLDGKLDLKAELAYRPGTSQPFSYDVRVDVSDGTVKHPRLPLPLERLEASLQCSNGELRLEKLSARSGKTQIEGRGWALLPCIDQTFEGSVEVRHLELTEALFAQLPEKQREVQQRFRPGGTTTVRAACARRGGVWHPLASGAPSTITLLPESMGVTFFKFPYALERMTGSIELNLLTQVMQTDATAYSGDQPVIIKGTWKGAGTEAEGRFDIVANALPLDEKLLAALPARFQKLARSFHATGKGDIKAHVRQRPGDKEPHTEFHARFYDGKVLWDQFPYPLEQVSGFLDIYNKHFEFRDFRGTHEGAQVMVQGASREDKAGHTEGVTLDISGRNVLVDEEVYKALKPMPQLVRAWDTFQPQGRMNFAARIDYQLGAPQDMVVNLDLDGCRAAPTFFPYPLAEVAGSFYYRKNRLEVSKARARHGPAQFTLDKAAIDLPAGGGFYADVPELRAKGLVLDEDLVKALPRGLRGTATALNVRSPVEMKTRLVVMLGHEAGSQPDVFWDGQLWMRDATFSTGVEWSKVTGSVAAVGRYNGRQLLGLNGNVLLSQAEVFKQPFRDLQAKFTVKENAPDVLLLGLRGPIHGGDISGQVRLEMNSSLRYELNLTASQIDLAEFGKHNLGANAQLQGIAVGRLHLTGQGATTETLDGNGSLDVPNGKLYNLPLLLDLLKFLGLRWPDRTAFEELHALFTITGRRVSVRKLELLGNAISLSGKGEFNLDGTDVALDFYPSWARVEQILPPAVRPFPPVLSKNLLTIEMRGKITSNPEDRKFIKKPVPALVDPLLQMRDRFTAGPTIERRPSGGGVPASDAPTRLDEGRKQ